MRDKPQYLFTLQQGIYAAQMDEMQAGNIFQKITFAQGYRYSLNSRKVPGHPDIYLRKYNTAIFIHGFFWHRHFGWQYVYMPKLRIEFWQKKFEVNVKRDYIVRMKLQDKGIKCRIVWECTVKGMKRTF